MSITNTNTIAKIAAVIAGLGLVALSFASFAPAKAATTEELQAQIATLLAQIQSLQAQLGTSSTQGTVAMQFNSDLTIGSTGADVTALQQFLVAQKFLQMPANVSYGYFGAITQSALGKYQAAQGITPAVGYFGPITRAKVNAMTTTTSTGGTSTGGTSAGSVTLSGAGRLTNVDTTGDIESNLNEGDASTAVLGISADAKDGDVQVQRVDVKFTIANVGGQSSNLSKYISDVSLYLGSKKLASMEPSDGDKSGRVVDFRFADLNGVIKEGTTGTLYVKVTPIESVGTNEADATVTVEVPTDGIRAIAADGISETYGGATLTEDFTVSAASVGTGTLSDGSDNPDDTVVKVNTDSTTEDVTLLALNLKAKKQDITVHDLPIQLTIAGVSGGLGGGVGSAIQTVKLMDGSTVLKSKSVTATASTTNIVFDSIDQDISKDDTANYTVVATIKKQDGNYTVGSTIVASTTASATLTTWDVEDVNGDAVVVSGSSVGGTVTLQTTGVTVALNGTPSYVKTPGPAISGGADSTQYTISFKVTAGDDDIYVGGAAPVRLTTPTTAATGNGVNWATTTTSTAAALGTNIPTSNFSAADTVSGDLVGSYYKLGANTTRTFTLQVVGKSAAAGYTGVQLVGIPYGLTTSLGSYYTTGLDTFKTVDVSMAAPN